jgi:hypothetical protein
MGFKTPNELTVGENLRYECEQELNCQYSIREVDNYSTDEIF